MNDPILQTSRLALRPLAEADAGFVLDLLHDPLWLRFIGNRNVHDLEGARRYVERAQAMYAQHGHGLWLVERRRDRVRLGLAGLIRREQLRDPDLGFGLLGEHHGHGYGYEASRAVLDWGLATRGLERIVAITSPENRVSRCLLEKLGFRYERTYDYMPGDPVRLYAVGEAEAEGDAGKGADARA